MPPEKTSESADDDYLSPEDIRLWTETEVQNAKRAYDLRVKELQQLSTEYSAGKLTAQQADEAHTRYYARWGEALRGAYAEADTTDEAILQQLDEITRRLERKSKSGGNRGSGRDHFR